MYKGKNLIGIRKAEFMADSLAINGLYNDPYLMQALNSPNYYQMQQAQQSVAQTQIPAVATTATDTATATNPAFQGKVAESSDSGTGTAVALAATAAIGGTALWILSRGKARGAKGIVEQFKKGWESFGKNAKKSEKLMVRNENGLNIVAIPNQTNRIYTDSARGTAKQQLEAIGLKNGDKAKLDVLTTTKDGKTVLAEGVQIRRGTYTLSNGNIATFRNGKVVKYTDSTGKDILIQYTEPARVAKYKAVNEANKKEIDDILAGLNQGQNLDKISNLGVLIKQNGITRKMTNTAAGSELQLDWALSKKFGMNDIHVDSYRKGNSQADEFLTQIAKGKTGVGKIVGAEYTTKMHDGKNITLIIENGVIRRAKDASGRWLGQTELESYNYRNKKTFDDVFKNEKKFKNVIRCAA